MDNDSNPTPTTTADAPTGVWMAMRLASTSLYAIPFASEIEALKFLNTPAARNSVCSANEVFRVQHVPFGTPIEDAFYGSDPFLG